MTTFPSFLVWFISYVWFTPSFVEETDPETEMYLNIQSEVYNNNKDKALNTSCEKLMDSRLCHFKAISLEKIQVEKPDIEGFTGTIRYFKAGIIHIYKNNVCFTALVHAFFVCLFWKVRNNLQ